MTVWPLDPEFDHSSAQGAWVDPKKAGRASGPSDAPIQIFEHAKYVFPLHVIKGLD
jgi:hypothetical protein